jgi:hypothetical protein
MMVILPLSVLFLVVVIVLVVGSLVSAFRRGRGGGSSLGESKPQAASGVTLNCPQCGKETEAAFHVCSHCGKEL